MAPGTALMKLCIMSDIHLEFAGIEIPHPKEEQILVLAGDVCLLQQQCEFLQQVSGMFHYVIYVFGNHEFYDGDILAERMKTQDFIKKESLQNVFLLENATKEIDDVVFICATLWTDFDNENPNAMLAAQYGMNDFQVIFDGHGVFTPLRALEFHKLSREFIFHAAEKHSSKKIVVVSHHAPSFRSVPDEYTGDRLNGAYATALDERIETSLINLWIHGHIHAPSDYMIGRTRVFANPRGYVGYERCNESFNPSCVIEV